MKNQISIIVNGIGFNCEVAAGMPVERFLSRHMPTKLKRLGSTERERILREAHRLCLEKVKQVKGTGEPPVEPPQDKTPVDPPPVDPPQEKTPEAPKPGKSVKAAPKTGNSDK